MKKVIPLLALVVASSAMAEGGYVGLGVGQAKVQDVEVINFGPGVSASVDDHDTSFKFFGGYQFNPNFAGEVSYENFGQISVKYTDGIDSINMTAKATAFTLSALGLLPVNESVSVFGRFGVAMANVDMDVTSTVGLSGSTSGSSTKPMYGLGIQYDLPKALIRFEYSRYTDVGDNDTGKSDIDVIGISGGIKF